MVSPRPACTKKASSGFAPCKAPCLHCKIKKLLIMDFMVIHVLLSIVSNAKGFNVFRMEFSTIIKNLHTEMYRHSLSFPANVLAPHITVPFAGKLRITFIDLPKFTSIFNDSWSTSFNKTEGAFTLFKLTLAGTFHTPELLSTAEYTPAIAAEGGSITVYLVISVFIAV